MTTPQTWTCRILIAASVLLWTPTAFAGFPKTPVKKCAGDAVVAGTVCMDKYEASVWQVPDPTGTNKSLVNKIRKGKATAAALMAAGATQLGTASDNYACGDDGQDCAGVIYAVSLPGVIPAEYITWFQAQEACANSGKRLPTSAEWQVAANGTPDPGGADDGSTTCNTSDTLAVTATGSRPDCVSARGAYDMVGNLWERVADWVPASTSCTGWGGFSDDMMCLVGANTTATAPGALVRGGGFTNSSGSGPLAVNGVVTASSSGESVGFRCAR